jgi:competence ComEA-like helix-hairpin-helix protein
MLNLTRDERQVILFLITIALLGAGINFLIKRYSSLKTVISLEQNIGKIDLNKADKEILMSIVGIGEKLAQRILEYRRENGDFSELEELKKIKGISAYRFDKLKDSIYVK